MNRMRSR